MIPVTFYATTDLAVTFVQVSRLLAGLALVYGLANWLRKPWQVTLLCLGLVGVGLALALLGVAGALASGSRFFLPSQFRIPVPGGEAINPNMIAGALVLLLPFPLALLLLEPSHPLPAIGDTLPGPVARVLNASCFRRALWMVAFMLQVGVLGLTRSRGGWMGASAAIFVILVRRWRYLLGVIPAALGWLGFLAWRGKVGVLLDWFSSTGAVSGWDKRAEIWSRALYMIQDFPFTGIGAGTFGRVVNTLYPLFLVRADPETIHAHNLLLQVAVDLGIPGLIAFVSLLLLTFWSALDSADACADSPHLPLASVAWAGVASLVGMLIHGMVDAATWILGRGAFVPWLVVGAVISLELLVRRRDGNAVGFLERKGRLR
jgi:putative inorganic carbon (HCO3(-)) transporter